MIKAISLASKTQRYDLNNKFLDKIENLAGIDTSDQNIACKSKSIFQSNNYRRECFEIFDKSSKN